MESYCFLFLVLLVSCTVSTDAQGVAGNCDCIEVGHNNFYKIIKLRQFPRQEPLWVNIKDEVIYYNLNGATFMVGNRQKDDITVHGIDWTGKTWEIQDASQNKLVRNQTNAYVFSKPLNRAFRINFDDIDSAYNFYEDYSAVLEPHAQVAFMLKKPNSPTQYGKLFWLAFKQPIIEKDAIVAKRLDFFDGTLISMDVDGAANSIVLAAKKNNIGIVYLLQHFAYNPCPKFKPESVVMKFVQLTYNSFKEVVLRKGSIKCENYRLDLTEVQEAERSAACKAMAEYSQMNEAGKKIINALIEEGKSLRSQIDLHKVRMQDATTKLHNLLKTAVLNKQANDSNVTSVFSQKLMTTEIDEYSADKYMCVLKDELEKGEKDLDIGTQMSYLKDALLMVNEDLEEMSN